ncbi:MFS transporter [Streptomyces sp. NPDC014894]|uniref:MFS transporter n=1 Tax=Streptomyces sp. NPDC014894 TaxID=3364931 RepID=UPI0036FBE2BD
MPSPSPWRVPDFRTLFSAAVLTNLAVNIGHVTVPLIAVTALDAGPGEVGLLATLTTVAFLLIGLPAGAWIDRMRHRRVLIAAELVRGVLTLSIPLAWQLDALTLEHLYVAVLLTGCATVFGDVAAQSALPGIVGRESLVGANTALVSLQAAGQVAGRGAGGALVQLLTAPAAAAAVGLLHLVSALRYTGIREAPRPGPGERPPRLTARIREGLRHVLAHRELRALVLAGSLSNLGLQLINTLLPVLFTRELGLSPAVLGLYWAAGGVGVFLGARAARVVVRRWGGDHSRAIGFVGLALAPAPLAIPLLDRGGWLWLAAAGWVLAIGKVGVDNVLAVTLRQRLTPDGLLGRMNATFRFMLMGALALGSALAGVIGELAGVRAAMWAGAVCMGLSFVPVLITSLLRRRGARAAENGGEPEERGQMRELTFRGSDGCPLHAEVSGPEATGSGRDPVILLHGGGPDHRSLLPLAARLGPAHTAVLPDIRGWGRSVCADPARHTWSRYADDVTALQDRLGAERAVLVGTGLGGTIALRTALEHPDRVRAIVVISVEDIEDDEAKEAERLFFERFAARVRAEGVAAAWAPVLPGLAPLIGNLVREAIPRSDPASVAAFCALGEDRAFREVSELAAITAPALIVPGMDARHPTALAAEVARTLPHGRLAPVALSGELLTAEDLGAAMGPLVADFLAELQTPCPGDPVPR